MHYELDIDLDKLNEGYYDDEINSDETIDAILDISLEEEYDAVKSLLTIEPYDEGTMIDIVGDITEDDIL